MPKRSRTKGPAPKAAGRTGTTTVAAKDHAHAASVLTADLQERESTQTQAHEHSADESDEADYAIGNQLPEFVAKEFQFATCKSIYDASPNSSADDFGFVDDVRVMGIGSRGFSSTYNLCAAMCKKTAYDKGAERQLLSFSDEDEGKVRILKFSMFCCYKCVTLYLFFR